MNTQTEAEHQRWVENRTRELMSDNQSQTIKQQDFDQEKPITES
jgi:hypothetical protein